MHVMMTLYISAVAPNDADLVIASLAGDRDAFGHIVSRYQSLICSLAYSATGSRAPAGTGARNLHYCVETPETICASAINSALGCAGIAPIVSTIFCAAKAANPCAPPPRWKKSTTPLRPSRCRTIKPSATRRPRSWCSLERIPEIYREPLVLFYREHQSIETVAVNLELTEDTVKQRLSRGRKLLQEQVLAFVEGALERTNPGRAFTLSACWPRCHWR